MTWADSYRNDSWLGVRGSVEAASSLLCSLTCLTCLLAHACGVAEGSQGASPRAWRLMKIGLFTDNATSADSGLALGQRASKELR